MPAVLKIDIIADATKAARALNQTGDAGQSTQKKMLGLGKAVASGMAVGAVVAFGKASLDAATESGVATKRLETIFRSMGDTTGKAAKSAEDYAAALSRKIGVDDESIMAAQAQLATFGAVSNETARAAGIFDRATGAAADLAAAGFGSLDTNSVQLGKALQDPVKGVNALARSGVTFTAAQKDAIAAMVKSGDLLGAQKLVLGAVETQVKGTAEATATSQDKMKVAFGETQEAVGRALLPILAKLAPILEEIAGFVEKNVGWLLPLAVALGVLAVAYQVATIAAAIFTTVGLGPMILIVLAIMLAIAALIAIGYLIVRNWKTIQAVAAAVWGAVLAVVQSVWRWISSNWPLLLAILTGPIGIAVLLITRNWQKIRDAAAALVGFVVGQFQRLVDFISGIAGSIGRIAGNIANAIKGPINAVLRAWNGLEFKVPEVNVGPIHFGGETIGLPDIPLLATGGSVLRTGLAVVHRGETFSGIGGSSSSGASTVINVHVATTGLGADTPAIQRAVVDALRSYTGRNGPLPIPVRNVA